MNRPVKIAALGAVKEDEERRDASHGQKARTLAYDSDMPIHFYFSAVRSSAKLVVGKEVQD